VGDNSFVVCFEEVKRPKKSATCQGLNTLPVKFVVENNGIRECTHSGGGTYVLGSYMALKCGLKMVKRPISTAKTTLLRTKAATKEAVVADLARFCWSL
jgi:hypothetical protein